jgi:hypothetical protein
VDEILQFIEVGQQRASLPLPGKKGWVGANMSGWCNFEY